MENKNKVKKTLQIGFALAALFFSIESEKPANPYHKIITKEIGKNYRFKNEIIEYYSEDYFSREDTKIRNIIVHATDSDNEDSCLDWLASENKHSAHYLIAKDGIIYNIIPNEFAAYHAGRYFNKRSIGIEVIQGVNGDFYNRKELFNPLQLDQTVTLIKFLMEKYNILKKEIIGHHELSSRKGDPGERNMGAILSRIP